MYYNKDADIPCTVMLAGLLSTTSGGNPSILVILRQRYTPVRFTVALVIVRTPRVCVSFDKVAIWILSLSSTTPPSLVQVISGEGKPVAEQERLTLTPTEITAGTGCSTKKALTMSGEKRKAQG